MSKEPFSIPDGLTRNELVILVQSFAPEYGLLVADGAGYLTHNGGILESEVAELTAEHLEVYLAGAIAYKGMKAGNNASA